MNLLRLTPSKLQRWGSSSKSTRNILGRTELSGIGVRTAGSAFSQTEVLAEAFDEPSPHRAGKQVPHLSLYQPGSHCSPGAGDSLRPSPTQLVGPPKLFPVDFPYKWPVLAHASDFPKISQTSSPWPQCTPYLSLSGLQQVTFQSLAVSFHNMRGLDGMV